MLHESREPAPEGDEGNASEEPGSLVLPHAKGKATQPQKPAETRRLSNRLNNLRPSCTLELKEISNTRIAEGLPVYDFGLGENSYDLPDSLIKSATDAMESGNTGYIAPSGMPELRSKILEWLNLQNKYTSKNVIVSCGAKQAILNAFLAICNPEDVVLLAVAPWISYGPIALCASATPVQVLPKDQISMKITKDDLLKAFADNPRRKIFLLNNPCNPTGQLYTEKEVNELLNICVDHGVYFILDRLYWKVLFDGRSYPEPAINKHTKPWLIQIDGLSKNFYKLGGMRVGWSVAPSDLSEAMDNLQSHHSSGTAVPSQHVALEVLSEDYNSVQLQDLQKKRDIIIGAAQTMPYVKVAETQGSYYSFWDVRAVFGKQTPAGTIINNSDDMAHYLINSFGVVTSSGKAFGQDGFLRLSFAIPEESVLAGMGAMREALESLGDPSAKNKK